MNNRSSVVKCEFCGSYVGVDETNECQICGIVICVHCQMFNDEDVPICMSCFDEGGYEY